MFYIEYKEVFKLKFNGTTGSDEEMFFQSDTLVWFYGGIKVKEYCSTNRKSYV